MIKHIWTILARNIITDSATNLMSYINCIEEVIAKELPARLPTIGIGSVFEKDSGKEETLRVRYSLVAPSGKSVQIVMTEEILMKARRHRLNVIAGNLSAEEDGVYKIRVEILNPDNWVVVTEVPFLVGVKK